MQMTANPYNDEKLGVNDELTREFPFLSIVIVNWNSKDCVRDCLKSIYRYASDLQPEIIVVDSASYDGCGEMLATEFLNVIFVQSDGLEYGYIQLLQRCFRAIALATAHRKVLQHDNRRRCEIVQTHVL